MKERAKEYLQKLCAHIPERCVGSDGNREAAAFFRDELTRFGWETETQEFGAMDWEDGGAELYITDGAEKSGTSDSFHVLAGPYSPGCSTEAKLAAAGTPEELERVDAEGKVLLVFGDLAKEQLMPKNFVFYNPEEHRRIISLLEKSGCKALICATGRNAALAGGVYPFPLIEDGDFNIPSVYMTEEEGKRLLPFAGRKVRLTSRSRRIPGSGCNVIGKKGVNGDKRIVLTAHIDAKKGTPGAIDNATGVIILLLTAGLLETYGGTTTVELTALNGEDYYAVSGQMKYIEQNQNRFDSIFLNINIDGAGYFSGPTAFSFYDVSEAAERSIQTIIDGYADITVGPRWPQGDHSIFLQYGVPAVAVSSEWFIENIDSQEITHTPKDNPDIVDCEKLVTTAKALAEIIGSLSS